MLGGNGVGKSTLGAYKTVQYLLENAPPRPNCPFWIISKSYEMVGGTAWGEKLKKYIHPRNIKWVSWLNKSRDWPAAVGLRNGWILEFKSWEQGREAFQARSIGGAWFDEQFPQDVFLEVFARTRDYNAPMWFTLTPIEPDAFLQTRYDDPPDGWEWFSLDLEDNRKSRGGYVDDGWIDAFIAETPEDFRDVRIRGKFAGFAGAVYKMWRREVHVVPPFPGNVPPRYGVCVRAIDFGWNNPFVCLWLYRDPDGSWTVYDEHYKARELIQSHAASIKRRVTPVQGIVRTWADPEAAQDRQELAALGIGTASAKKDVMHGIEEVQRMLTVQANGKPRLFVTANCTNTIREIASYQWESNTTERKDAADEPRKKDDHCVDSLRYAIFSEKQGQWLTPDRIVKSSIASSYSNVMG